MPVELLLPIVAVFLSVALLSGGLTMFVLSRSRPGRRRLNDLLGPPSPTGLVIDAPQLSNTGDEYWERFVKMLPPPLTADARLRRDLTFAGLPGAKSMALYLISQPICGALLAVAAMMLISDSRAWLVALFGAVLGYMTPGLLLGRRIKRRRTDVENGLADALDLFVLCLEAGSSLDQAIVKAGEELAVAYPVLAEQLRILISEMRAGKPRLDAFRGLAQRTKVDDARALVAMLVQTDRFGTSLGQALRTHASVCRNKRRQRAEERAEKVGVKLVFPLVFCLFPALFVVLLGPAAIQFIKAFP